MSRSVRAVDRALDILLSFTQEEPALTLSQICLQTGMSKSTVHRFLGTLENRRFLVKDAITGKYQLGYRFLEIASPLINNGNRQWAAHYLDLLAEKCGETVDLAAMEGDQVIYLQVVESRQRVKIAAAPGQRLPMSCTATGKAFLAFLPEEQVRRIFITGSSKYTCNTFTKVEELLENLQETRRRGFAISIQEYEQDINAVAAPILDENGRPILAIAVVGPSFRLPPERLAELGGLVHSVIENIQREVGMTALTMMTPREFSYQQD